MLSLIQLFIWFWVYVTSLTNSTESGWKIHYSNSALSKGILWKYLLKHLQLDGGSRLYVVSDQNWPLLLQFEHQNLFYRNEHSFFTVWGRVAWCIVFDRWHTSCNVCRTKASHCFPQFFDLLPSGSWNLGKKKVSFSLISCRVTSNYIPTLAPSTYSQPPNSAT